jgi:hypothetical protein
MLLRVELHKGFPQNITVKGQRHFHKNQVTKYLQVVWLIHYSLMATLPCRINYTLEFFSNFNTSFGCSNIFMGTYIILKPVTLPLGHMCKAITLYVPLSRG